MFQLKLLLATVIALVFIGEKCKACVCMLNHPQEAYCLSTIAVLARSTGVLDERYLRKFTIEVDEILKSETTFPNNTLIAYSSKFTNMCGIAMEENVPYLLSGYYNKKKNNFFISTCAWNKKWEDLTSIQQDGWKNSYKKNCDCRVSIVSSIGSTLSPPLSNQCHLPFGDNCKSQYSLCAKEDDVCGWTTSDDLSKCEGP